MAHEELEEFMTKVGKTLLEALADMRRKEKERKRKAWRTIREKLGLIGRLIKNRKVVINPEKAAELMEWLCQALENKGPFVSDATSGKRVYLTDERGKADRSFVRKR